VRSVESTRRILKICKKCRTQIGLRRLRNSRAWNKTKKLATNMLIASSYSSQIDIEAKAVATGK
jgi:hypothetical protein